MDNVLTIAVTLTSGPDWLNNRHDVHYIMHKMHYSYLAYM